MSARNILAVAVLLWVGNTGTALGQDASGQSCTLSTSTFDMKIPCDWQVPEGTADADPVIVRLNDNGGLLRVHYAPDEVSLRAISRKLLQTARTERWKIRKKRRTRVDGKRALVLLIDIHAGRLETRQLFYFFNADGGRYILHFGADKKAFKYRDYRRAAASFKKHLETAQTP